MHMHMYVPEQLTGGADGPFLGPLYRSPRNQSLFTLPPALRYKRLLDSSTSE